MATRGFVFQVIRELRLSLEKLEARLWGGFGGHPPLGPALAVQGPFVREDDVMTQRSEGGLAGLLDGLLWAVPKHRRSIQRNRTRRRAVEKQVAYIPGEKFTTCQVCGHTKMMGFLCGHCLIRIRQETEAIKKRLFEGPEEEQVLREREAVVVYRGETPGPGDGGKRVVEMKKERPSWFGRALLE